MSVDATPSIAKIEGIPEQWRASRFLQVHPRVTKKNSIPVRRWSRLRKGEHEYMSWLDSFLLDARWSDVHLVTEKVVVPASDKQ